VSAKPQKKFKVRRNYCGFAPNTGISLIELTETKIDGAVITLVDLEGRLCR